MSRHRGFVSVVALVTALLGCGRPTVIPEDDRAVFRTDHEDYVPSRTRWGYEALIPFTYSNRTSDTLYVTNCNGVLPITLDKQVGGEWASPVVSSYPPCLSEPVVIAPRSDLVDSVRVTAGTAETPDTQIAGTYRLVWHGLVTNYRRDGEGLGDSIPLTQRVSNSFRLDGPRQPRE